MKELKNDDLLHWIKSAPLKRHSNKKILKHRGSYPKPTKLTKDKLRKLAKSNIKLDSEIDLHGLDRLSAREKVDNFVKSSISRGYRYINVITGKGSGVIQRVVKEYLDEETTFQYVIGYSNAPRKQGGDGAIILHLRKKEIIG